MPLRFIGVNEDATVIRRGTSEEAPAATTHEANAYLIVLSGRSVGKMFKVPAGEFSIGRSMDADVRLEDEGISRLHAKICHNSDGRVMLHDLQSTNGTFVNGDRAGDRQLTDGDRIQVGSVTILKFSYQDKLEEQFQQQLYESATRDQLTHAYNKRFYDEQLDKDFSHAQRNRTNLSLPLSVLMLDIDHFKPVNDTHGHPAGDYVLQRFAATILGALRNGDTFCRVGGEEFAVIMRDSDLQRAVTASDRMRELVESTRFIYNGTEIPITMSVGVTHLDHDKHATQNDLIEAADQLLYEAKRSGRNRVCSPQAA